MKTQADVCACLRRTADALEVKFEWFYWSILHALPDLPDGPSDCDGFSRSDVAGMDLGMAQEALESASWWLRKAAADIEGGDAPKSREDGSG